MNSKQMRKYMHDNYWKDDQKLLLETWYDVKDMKKRKSYFEQEINYKDYTFIHIQTWDMLRYTESIAHTPYCMKGEFCCYQITVPKFGQLTDDDIAKAIAHVLRQVKCYFVFNFYLDGNHIAHFSRNNYEMDTWMLRSLNENSN